MEQELVAIAVFHSPEYPDRWFGHQWGPDHTSSHDPGDLDDGEHKIIHMWCRGVRHPMHCKWERR